MYKQFFVLFVLAVLVLASGCATTTTDPQPPVQPTTIPTPLPTTGSLELSSTPQGAEIYLNDVYRGTTPSTIPDLPNGSYHVELRLRDHTAWDTDVEVQAGNTSSVHATLVPLPVPTTISTPVPTTVPPEPFLGCWIFYTQKGNKTDSAYILELQSGGTGQLNVGYPMIIHWSQDPATNVIYVSGPNPNNPAGIFHMDFEYNKVADTLFWREVSAPFTRIPCEMR
ncbi:MAG: PEGA domain-containing protein [Methanomicrobiaceae archaeon]|nr:PEGA domain-containing protein [Methanomicrobiaceae archaeon]